MSRRERIVRSAARLVALLTVAAFVLPIAPAFSQGSITTFPLATISLPQGITAGTDGALWFTEALGNKIGRMTTAGVVSNEFSITTAGSNPNGITQGPDGNLWFTESDGNKIGRITPTGTVTEFPIPTAASKPLSIAAGADGALWFTESDGNKIGKITTTGIITEFPIPTAASSPSRIAAGPAGDAALYFTESATSANKIGRITTGGAITEFPVASPATGLGGITLGPDNNLWATAFGSVLVPGSAKVLKITTTGTITPFTDSLITSPGSIAKGSDGNLWFAQSLANNIGRITPAGAVSVVSLSGGNIFPGEITTGPPADGGLWFTEPFVSRIGKVTPGGTGGGATLNGNVTLEGLNAARHVGRTVVVKLFTPGTQTQFGINHPATTDASGNFTVTDLPAGTFDIDVKNSQRVSRRALGVVIGAGATVTQAFGVLLAGDVNDGNFVNSSDYNILQATFFKELGDTGYDPRADLNGDDGINASDYNLLQRNFFVEGPCLANTTGCVPTSTSAGAGGPPRPATGGPPR